MLASIGAVAGIDVGFSATRRSSAICCLMWDERSIRWRVARYRATDIDRTKAYNDVVDSALLLAVALDGPLRSGLDEINVYRRSEELLTRGLARVIGKPGQSSTPVGRRLNGEANACARAIVATARIEKSFHQKPIHPTCIVEAFPSSFLGLMLSDPTAVAASRKNRSDLFFRTLVDDETLLRLLNYMLPGRELSERLDSIRDHDERAAFVCALTALGVAGRDYCAVGDGNGWIVLPPRAFIQPWAWAILRANDPGGCLVVEP